ncbi:hypothetical protein HY029_01665 [Candidatus Gottesmanbacteria bacterium]|nr:hypothetical protein [Candidatus Gottesmanbacteria bacterium]
MTSETFKFKDIEVPLLSLPHLEHPISEQSPPILKDIGERLIIILGQSGAGKTSIVREVERSKKIKSVRYPIRTTRPLREDEVAYLSETGIVEDIPMPEEDLLKLQDIISIRERRKNSGVNYYAICESDLMDAYRRSVAGGDETKILLVSGVLNDAVKLRKNLPLARIVHIKASPSVRRQRVDRATLVDDELRTNIFDALATTTIENNDNLNDAVEAFSDFLSQTYKP